MCKGATGVTKKLPPVPREVARKYAAQRRGGEGQYQALLPQEDYEEEPAGKHEKEPAGNAEARTVAEPEPGSPPPSTPPSTPPWNCILLAIRAPEKKPPEQTPTASTGIIIPSGAFDDISARAEELMLVNSLNPEVARQVSRVQERATRATQRAEVKVERLLARVQAQMDAISGSEHTEKKKDDPLLHHPLLRSVKGLLRATLGGAGETVANALDCVVRRIAGETESPRGQSQTPNLLKLK
mmetsp:Transcript_34362/g.110380  ORF Transcript_34362/g.110380 Transcript_34362/m.110380 type:complete len:241 (+) Transcript_34362:78-800(+)